MQGKNYILPAAEALFNKKKVFLHEIPLEWSKGTVVVCRKENGNLHFIAGSEGKYFDLDAVEQFYHDQTGAKMGSWLVVNQIDYKKNGNDVEWNPEKPFNDDVNVLSRAALAVFK